MRALGFKGIIHADHRSRGVVDAGRQRFYGDIRDLPDAEDRILLSGTKLRKALSEGAEVSDKFSRPEVLTILRAYYGSLKDDEKVEIKMSGHSAK